MSNQRRNQRFRTGLPCIYEGAILEYCNKCNGENKHVRECEIHGKATYMPVSNAVQSCNRCDKYEADKTLAPVAATSTLPERKPKGMDMRREELKQRLLKRAQEQKEQREKQLTQAVSNTSNHTMPVPTQALRTRRLILRAKARENQTNTPVPSRSLSEPKGLLAVSKIKPNSVKWAIGVTTVPIRRHTTLPITLNALTLAGFPEPRLFVDRQTKETIEEPDTSIINLYNNPSLPITLRSPNINTYGNWFLSLMELYIRNPNVDRYALFQDDLIMSLGVREYLEHCEFPDNVYMNLITYPQNEAEKIKYFPKELPSVGVGTTEEKYIGWYPSNQMGKSALALVFNRPTVLKILGSEYLLNRFQDEKSWQNVDGALSTAMRKSGVVEYVHTPSLVRHTGSETTMGPGHPKRQPIDLSFRGEDYDIMDVVRNLE